MDRSICVVNQKNRFLFYLLIALSLIGVGILQFGRNNTYNSAEAEEKLVYQGSFEWEKADGSRVPIQVPGTFAVPAGETLTVVTQLPKNYTQCTLAIRSSLQDVRFYVGGELRAEYDTSNIRLVGKNSASSYVFCPTSEADAGKEVRIELTSNTSKYSGVINTVYCGDKADIWEWLFHTYGVATIIAFFLLFTGITTIIFGISLGIIYHVKFEMEYLGWCVFMAAVWMIGESKLRQFFVPNPSALASLCFVMIMLAPVALSYYMDMLQQGRYHRVYDIIENIAFLNLMICSGLHISGIADYIETLPVAHCILVAAVITVIVLLFCDARRGCIGEDKIIVTGIIIAMAAVVIEAVSAYFVVSISGLFIGTGMLILIIVNLVKTLKTVHNLENQRHKADMEKRKQQMLKMSLQMMQTLSATIEAKDEYTRGHSYRVSEYSGLIAKELGWEDEEIQKLKYTAHLHDIGTIGIPDMIQNKPTKLTDEEYAVIKNHTVIGSEILKNITLIDHMDEVARSHHERYDGTGYPDGLKGDEIPLYARIVAIAESYDAMKTKRIYRNFLDETIIYNEIRKNRGTQFDPEITDVFLKLLSENRLTITGEERKYSEFDESRAEIEDFISNVVTTMKNQDDSEGFDFLTGLPMRNRGERMVAEFMQQSPGYLVFLDMDNLKKINDIYGHKAGDRALKLLGSLLMDQAQYGVVCRLGGDEFLMFIPDVARREIAEIVEKILDGFAECKEKDIEISCASVSAGICRADLGDSFEECYTKADKALYYVKQNGKGSFFFYHQMGNEKQHMCGTGQDLKMISRALRDSGNYSGALSLEYRDFARVFEYINNLEERYKCECYLVMVTMETAPDSVMSIEDIEHALEYMEQAIRKKIRSVDICTRYSSMQYLLILFKTEEEQIPKVMKRIFGQYHEQYCRDDIIPKYEYVSLEKNRPAG